MLEDYISVKEASERYGVSESYITRLLREGRLKGQKLGLRVWMVNVNEVEAYLKEPRKRGRKPIDK